MTSSLGSIDMDLPKLLETRLLVQGNSGGGKSWALRRVLEQTAPHVQQLIIDPEGEFASLREKFDFVICAPRGADAVANPSTAAALARALWESGASAILDIYDLKAHERILFVRRFCEALVNAPKNIWHPTLVVIDEAHMFAPQVGQAESLGAVIDLATRGRKRGLALLAATQRLSKLHKDVAAELLNKMIGRTGLDVDVKRAADELGMTTTDARALRDLEPGEWFVYGPALSRSVTRTRIGPVATTHPKTGARGMTAPPPASAKVLSRLQKIEGIQRQAEDEVKTVATLTAQVTDLKRRLTLAEKAQPGIPEAEVQRRIKAALAEAAASVPAVAGERQASQRDLERLTVPLAKIRDLALQALGDGFAAMMREPASGAPPVRKVQGRVMHTPAPPAPPAIAPSNAVSGDLKAPEQRIVDSIAWWSAAGVASPTRHQVAFVAGYTVNGHFNNQCGTLRARGLLDYPSGGTLSLLDAGKEAANTPTAAPTRADLVSRVLGVLKGEPMRRVFSILVERGALSREDLAQAAGYTVNGHFNNIVGALNGIGIAEYPTKGMVGLTSIFSGLEKAA